MGFHEFTWVFGGWNHFQLGGPSWVVGGLGEVSGGYNLQNLAWTFADDVVGHSYCLPALIFHFHNLFLKV